MQMNTFPFILHWKKKFKTYAIYSENRDFPNCLSLNIFGTII